MIKFHPLIFSFLDKYFVEDYHICIFMTKARVMATKLPLTDEKAIIEKAKANAKQTGRSLSVIFENYLESITPDNKGQSISPRLKKIIGSVKHLENFDEEKELRDYLEKKHL